MIADKPGAGIVLVTDSPVVNNSSGSGCLKVRRSSVWAPSRGGTIIKYSSALRTPNTLSKYPTPTKHTQIRIFSQSLLLLCLVNWYILSMFRGSVCYISSREFLQMRTGSSDPKEPATLNFSGCNKERSPARIKNSSEEREPPYVDISPPAKPGSCGDANRTDDLMLSLLHRDHC